MWEIILGVGIFFLILEIFTPSVFFINFALACFVCAFLSIYIKSWTVLTIIFAILSFIFLYTIRPFFTKNKQTKEQKTGLEAKYIGKIATALEDIDNENGVISIYDERWQARSQNQKIEKGQKVKIISNDGLIMNVIKKD